MNELLLLKFILFLKFKNLTQNYYPRFILKYINDIFVDFKKKLLKV